MLQPHIQLDETVNAQCALLPGDPARLDRIAQFLEDVQQLAYNREPTSTLRLMEHCSTAQGDTRTLPQELNLR